MGRVDHSCHILSFIKVGLWPGQVPLSFTDGETRVYRFSDLPEVSC